MTEVRKSGYFGIIMDETSDISRTEEVSLCLRYVNNGETKETLVGFFATASTEGEVLYELAKTAINKLDLRLGGGEGRARASAEDSGSPGRFIKGSRSQDLQRK